MLHRQLLVDLLLLVLQLALVELAVQPRLVLGSAALLLALVGDGLPLLLGVYLVALQLRLHARGLLLLNLRLDLLLLGHLRQLRQLESLARVR